MIKSACKLLKKATTSSIALVLSGTLLVLLAKLLTLDNLLPSLMSYTGFLAIFAGVIIMLITMVAVLFPRVSQHLEQCQH